MTAVSAVFPGSRTLASWWKQLGPLRPRALWTGHLLLHRVEALASLHCLIPLEQIPLFVLKALALADRASLQELDNRLHLGPPLLRQLLRQLESAKLVGPEENGSWSLTELGQQGLRQGTHTQVRQERRVFYFVEAEPATGPSHYLSFAHPPVALPCPASAEWKFEARHLQDCVGRPADWKRRFGFPLEVQHIIGNDASTSPPQEWQRIILDRPEQLAVMLALVPAGEGQDRFLGFVVDPGGWVLHSAEPAFTIEAGWQEVFPELAMDLPLEYWQQAWRAWCQPRGLSSAEIDACLLERQGYRLRVTATPRLIERLRLARSDVFKGEAWLVAGTGRLRPAAQIELVEMKRERTPQNTSGQA
jgi:hypothetical protein